jgi:hypothetical protein
MGALPHGRRAKKGEEGRREEETGGRRERGREGGKERGPYPPSLFKVKTRLQLSSCLWCCCPLLSRMKKKPWYVPSTGAWTGGKEGRRDGGKEGGEESGKPVIWSPLVPPSLLPSIPPSLPPSLPSSFLTAASSEGGMVLNWKRLVFPSTA